MAPNVDVVYDNLYMETSTMQEDGEDMLAPTEDPLYDDWEEYDWDEEWEDDWEEDDEYDLSLIEDLTGEELSEEDRNQISSVISGIE
mgnify:CR=1 FL=1